MPTQTDINKFGDEVIKSLEQAYPNWSGFIDELDSKTYGYNLDEYKQRFSSKAYKLSQMYEFWKMKNAPLVQNIIPELDKRVYGYLFSIAKEERNYNFGDLPKINSWEDLLKDKFLNSILGRETIIGRGALHLVNLFFPDTYSQTLDYNSEANQVKRFLDNYLTRKMEGISNLGFQFTTGFLPEVFYDWITGGKALKLAGKGIGVAVGLFDKKVTFIEKARNLLDFIPKLEQVAISAGKITGLPISATRIVLGGKEPIPFLEKLARNIGQATMATMIMNSEWETLNYLASKTGIKPSDISLWDITTSMFNKDNITMSLIFGSTWGTLATLGSKTPRFGGFLSNWEKDIKESQDELIKASADYLDEVKKVVSPDVAKSLDNVKPDELLDKSFYVNMMTEISTLDKLKYPAISKALTEPEIFEKMVDVIRFSKKKDEIINILKNKVTTTPSKTTEDIPPTIRSEELIKILKPKTPALPEATPLQYDITGEAELSKKFVIPKEPSLVEQIEKTFPKRKVGNVVGFAEVKGQLYQTIDFMPQYNKNNEEKIFLLVNPDTQEKKLVKATKATITPEVVEHMKTVLSEQTAVIKTPVKKVEDYIITGDDYYTFTTNLSDLPLEFFQSDALASSIVKVSEASEGHLNPVQVVKLLQNYTTQDVYKMSKVLGKLEKLSKEKNITDELIVKTINPLFKLASRNKIAIPPKTIKDLLSRWKKNPDFAIRAFKRDVLSSLLAVGGIALYTDDERIDGAIDTINILDNLYGRVYLTKPPKSYKDIFNNIDWFMTDPVFGFAVGEDIVEGIK